MWEVLLAELQLRERGLELQQTSKCKQKARGEGTNERNFQLGKVREMSREVLSMCLSFTLKLAGETKRASLRTHY